MGGPPDPKTFINAKGEEVVGYVTINPDRRTRPWRNMKKDIAKRAAEKAKGQECQN